MQSWFLPHHSSFYLCDELFYCCHPLFQQGPHSLKHHLSAVAFCPFISVLLSCTRVTRLPDRVQGFAVHVSPHSSPLGEFCQTLSVEELS